MMATASLDDGHGRWMQLSGLTVIVYGYTEYSVQCVEGYRVPIDKGKLR